MKARVLIVDDSATVRADMRGVLSAAGFGTTLCESLTAARKALSEGEFDLVILDMLLPDGEGVDLLEELRRVPRTAHLPVLMLSTEAAVLQRLKGLSHGANDYVGKPYDSAYVVRRAHELTQVPEADAAPRLVSAGRRRRVLVVDGRIDFRLRASDALRKDGHDVIIAEKSAKFGLPEVLFNLFPGMGAYSFLKRRVGGRMARQLIEDGKTRTADELHELGLVDVLCEKGHGEAALRAHIAEREGRFATDLTLKRVRQRTDPVTRAELVEIVDLWADLALTLSEADLRRMDCLARHQERRRAGSKVAAA